MLWKPYWAWDIREAAPALGWNVISWQDMASLGGEMDELTELLALTVELYELCLRRGDDTATARQWAVEELRTKGVESLREQVLELQGRLARFVPYGIDPNG